uniref:Cytochrome P450 734A6 n=1 Tax=Fritillaria cirrhosa TaxID=108544 RepID=A0A1L7H7W0_9LILI|nr:cytochrome P450 734A6 [Fritillaria cirrhosa]
MGYVGLVLGALAVILISILWRMVVHLILKPYAITRSFKKQGVEGPRYKFWSGSLEEIRSMKKAGREMIMEKHTHDIIPRLLPHYVKWLSQHGEPFLYWFGPTPRICITSPEQVKQILSNKFGFFGKSKPNPNIMALFGKGLVMVEGSDWARHRRVVSPAFAMDKLKMMTTKVAECTLSMFENWRDQAKHQRGVVEVSQQFQELTADVISHTAFGSNYAGGKKVFLAQKELQAIVLATVNSVEIPGFKYLPTKRNVRKWKLVRRVKDTLMTIVQGRIVSNGSSYGNDLLGLMLEACKTEPNGKKGNLSMSMDEIIEECKTFFLAGHETTSHLLTWAMFLLSINPDWQERLREQVLSECGMEFPNSDLLGKLNLVTMFLFEVLRLYSPIPTMLRMAIRDMKLGSLTIPKGTCLTIPLPIIHRNKEVWGDDANEFNPMRFENGIAKAANHPNAFLAFSIGPRSCVGQNFAMLEAKTVLAMILQRFSFSLSPEYKHAPADIIAVQPQFGLPIVVTPLHD